MNEYTTILLMGLAFLASVSFFVFLYLGFTTPSPERSARQQAVARFYRWRATAHREAAEQVKTTQPSLPLLSPKTLNILEKIGIGIGYCLGGIILVAIAIPFVLLFRELGREYRHRRYINNRYG